MILREYTEQEARAFIEYYNESLSKTKRLLEIADSCTDASIIFAGQDDKEIAEKYSKLAEDFMRDAYNFTTVEIEIMGEVHV